MTHPVLCGLRQFFSLTLVRHFEKNISPEDRKVFSAPRFPRDLCGKTPELREQAVGRCNDNERGQAVAVRDGSTINAEVLARLFLPHHFTPGAYARPGACAPGSRREISY